VNAIPLADEFFEAVSRRQKRTTIRKGQRSYKLGTASLVSSHHNLPIQISRVLHKKFSELDQADAQADGFKSLDDLSNVLRRFYPAIASTDTVTIVEFNLL
jgi:hypothetical protein